MRRVPSVASQSRLPARNLSRSDEEKVKGDVGVVCGARKPSRGRGGSGMRNRRDGVPGDQRGDRVEARVRSGIMLS